MVGHLGSILSGDLILSRRIVSGDLASEKDPGDLVSDPGSNVSGDLISSTAGGFCQGI